MELDNMFQEKIGYLDWEFMIEEFPVEPDDPTPPQTGDESNMTLWISAASLSAVLLIILFIYRRKEKKENENKI